MQLLSVNVGMPKTIGTVNGAPVLSGFVKTPIAADDISVGPNQIDGDGQADLSVHGGPDKAVYCYPADHWPWWERDHAFPCRPGVFGENLTVEGADEDEIAIGDCFRWGPVLLEVSQPRAPCFKFVLASGRPDASALVTLSARSGWYFRVLQAGRAPARAHLQRERRSGGPSVREAFRAALHPDVVGDTLRRVAEANELAESWRRAVAKKLESR